MHTRKKAGDERERDSGKKGPKAKRDDGERHGAKEKEDSGRRQEARQGRPSSGKSKEGGGGETAGKQRERVLERKPQLGFAGRCVLNPTGEPHGTKAVERGPATRR